VRRLTKSCARAARLCGCGGCGAGSEGSKNARLLAKNAAVAVA
jgi:hypothetical protein